MIKMQDERKFNILFLILVSLIFLSKPVLSLIGKPDCNKGGDCEYGNLIVNNLTVKGNYFNVSVVNYNITGTMNVDGNVTADYYFGDGSKLSGITTSINGTDISINRLNASTVDVSGKLNVSGTNATFGQDITILGTLHGGSPVKIAGVNISNNPFSFKENKNSSSRFTLENENSGSNATAVISAKNDVGGIMSIGVVSSTYKLGEMDYNNATAIISRSSGATVFANVYNQPFIWDINPFDDNNLNNLEEIMRLDKSGLNVSTNLTADNVFLPQYIFSHTNETIPVNGANLWTNITFSQEDTDVKQGITHTYNDATNHTFTVMVDGIYNVDYDLDVEDTSLGASDIDVAARLILTNGSEVIGSVFETDITKQGTEAELSHNFLVSCRAGEQFIFQFAATDEDVQISTHGVFGEHPESVTVLMMKIANLP